MRVESLALFVSVIYGCSVVGESQLLGRRVAVPDGTIWRELDKARGLQNDRMLQQFVHDSALGNLRGAAIDPSAILSSVSSAEFASYNVSQKCANDTIRYIMDMVSRKPYAIKMLDSMAKPPAGIMEGNFQWIGAPEECRGVKSDDYVNGPGFNGRYCQAYFSLGGPENEMFPGAFSAFVYGFCVPDTCVGADVSEMLHAGLELLPIKGQNASHVLCAEDQKISTGAIVMFVIIGILVLLMIIGTAYQLVIQFMQREKDSDENILPVSLQHDVREDEEILTLTKLDPKGLQYKPGVFGQCLLAFSVLENGRKILDTTHASGTLAAIHGIRVLSMWWVILGHSYIFTVMVSDNITAMQDVMKRFSFQAISNATFSVDTFFFLSGLLVTYLTLKELNGGHKVNWAIFYLHRFWRLTPMYMFVIFFSTYVVPLFGSGAFKMAYNSVENPCLKYWWTNLLYINNLYPGDLQSQCFPLGWYLANDMQFHVISPLVIVLLYKRPKIGYAAMGVLLSGCLAVRAGLSVHLGLTSSLNDQFNMANGTQTNFNSAAFYVKPWNRIATYVIGMFVGYLLVKTSCKLKIHRVINLLGWAAAWAIALAVLYGLYGTLHGVVLSRSVDVFYTTVCRTAWGVAIGWLTFACLTGNGGPINAILAWKAWIPISRLTYAAYLTHFEVMIVYYQYRDRLLHVTDIDEIYHFLAALVISYCISFILSLMAEAPMRKLERIVLGKDKEK